MLRFKYLHYKNLYTQGGKGKHYIQKKKKQQGGALGINGVDYPDPSTFDETKMPDTKTMIKYLKGMYNAILKLSPEQQKTKTISDMLKEFSDVMYAELDQADMFELYTDWQYMFTDPAQLKKMIEQSDNEPKIEQKEEPKKEEPKKAVIKKDKKEISYNERVTMEGKRATFNCMLSGMIKQYEELKSKPENPQIKMKKDNLKRKIAETVKKRDYIDKRIRKHFPKLAEDKLQSKLDECHKEVIDLKKELESQIKSEKKVIEESKPKVDVKQESIKVKNKDTVYYDEEKQQYIEKPKVVAEEMKEPDIDEELLKLAELKKATVTPSLNSYNIKELKAIAKKEKIVGITGLKKKQLVQLIINARSTKKLSPIEPPKSVKISKKETVTPVVVSDIDPLHKKTVLELKAMCRDMGITGYGHKSKEQIIASIIAKKGITPSKPKSDDIIDSVLSSYSSKIAPKKKSKTNRKVVKQLMRKQEMEQFWK